MAQGRVKRKWRGKRQGFGLDIRTIQTVEGREDTVIVMQDSGGSFHTLVEIDAKQAAQRCGAPKNLTTKEAWKYVLRQQDGNGS